MWGRAIWRGLLCLVRIFVRRVAQKGKGRFLTHGWFGSGLSFALGTKGTVGVQGQQEYPPMETPLSGSAYKLSPLNASLVGAYNHSSY